MRTFLAAWATVGALLAQQPQLQPVGVASARGGSVVACAFDGDGTHMLTVGADGDVVYQDLTTFEVLSRHELPLAEVDALLLHPHEPRALFVVRPARDMPASVFALDLRLGDWQRLGEREVKVLGQDAAGERMAFVVMTPRGFDAEIWPWGTSPDEGPAPLLRRQMGRILWPMLGIDGDDVVLCEPADGQPSARCLRVPADGSPLCHDGGPLSEQMSPIHGGKGNTGFFVGGDKFIGDLQQLLSPEARAWVIDEVRIAGMLRSWRAPGGKLLVADEQGQLHVFEPGAKRPRVTAVHRAPVERVVWSPDGRFLGIVALGGARFVDSSGEQVGEHQGSCAIMAGEAGPEFMILDGLGIERFHASSRRTVGERIEHEALRTAVVRYHGRALRLWGPAEVAFGRGPRTLRKGEDQQFARELLLIDGLGQLSVPRLAHQPDYWLLLNAKSSIAADSAGMHLVCWAPQRDWGCGTGLPDPASIRVLGVVQAVDAEGRELGRAEFAAGPRWLRRSPGGKRFVVGLDDGQVFALDPTDIEHPTALVGADDDPPLQWFGFVDEQCGLGGDGEQLWWIDTRTFARKPAQLPAGVGRPFSAVMAPDGKHVALVSGCDVTIAAIR